MQALMAADVSTLAGPKGKHNMVRMAVRHGRERGSVTLGGRRRTDAASRPVRRPPARRHHSVGNRSFWASAGDRVPVEPHHRPIGQRQGVHRNDPALPAVPVDLLISSVSRIAASSTESATLSSVAIVSSSHANRSAASSIRCRTLCFTCGPLLHENRKHSSRGRRRSCTGRHSSYVRCNVAPDGHCVPSGR